MSNIQELETLTDINRSLDTQIEEKAEEN